MSAPIGNWQNAVELLLEKAKTTRQIDEYTHEITEEHIMKTACTKDCTRQVDWLEAYFLHCRSMNSKSADKAAAAKLEGNKLFQRKDYAGAVQKYTEAILHCPTSSLDLALAYGNRSAALFRRHRYELCLWDIEEAFSSGFPEGNRHKLDERKAQCLLQIRELAKPKPGDLTTETNKTRQAIEDGKSIARCKPVDEIPTPSYGFNNVLLQASAAVDMKHNDEQGRFLVANRDLKAGDTLIVERPFAFVLLPDHYNSRCHHCLARLETVYPCHRCTAVRYCQPECRETSWEKYHHVECFYLDLLHSVGIAHLSLRVVLLAGKHFLQQFKTSQNSPRPPGCIPGLDRASGQYSRGHQTVYDLMTHLADMAVDDLFQYSQTAVLLLKILQHSGWFRYDQGDDRDCPHDVLDQHNIGPSTIADGNLQCQCCDTDKLKDEERCQNQALIKDINASTGNLSLHSKHCLSGGNDNRLKNNPCPAMSDNKVVNSAHSTNCSSTDCCVMESNNNGASFEGKHCGSESSEIIGATDLVNATDGRTAVDSETQRELEGLGTCSSDPAKETYKTKIKLGYTGMDSDTDAEFEGYVGSLLFRHILQLVCNAHAITDLHHTQAGPATHTQTGEISHNWTGETSHLMETNQVRIATAIYPAASFMNHSCDPTIISSFHKDTMIVRAVKDVPMGGEIFNCYGPHHLRMGWQERQQSLQQQYFFTCACQPCLAGHDGETIFHSFRCHGCDDSIPDTQTSPSCENCGAAIDIQKLRDQAIAANELFQRGLELLKDNHVKAATDVMLQCHVVRKSVLFKYNKQLSETEDCLARCYATIGEFAKSANYLKSSIATVELMYGGQSIELANELQKLSEILISAQNWKQALTVTETAITLFELHYGKSHDTVKELSLARKHLMELFE